MTINPLTIGAICNQTATADFSTVNFLCHWEEAGGSPSNTVNSSPRGVGVTLNGTATLTFTTPLYGLSCLNVTGAATSFAITGPSSDYTLGTGDFTMELAVYTGSPSQVGWVMSGNNNDIGFLLSSGTFSFRVGGSAVMGGGTVLTNTWQRIAVSRTGAVNRLFVDGIQVDTINSAFNCTMDTMSFGVRGPSFSGVCKIDEVRLTKGRGRYQGNYTVATGPFPNT